MALVAYDGFENYDVTDPHDVLNRRGGGLQWNTQNSAAWVQPGRSNVGSCISLGQAAALQGALSAALASGYIGFGFQITSSGAYPGNAYIYFYDLHGPGNVVQWTLVFNVYTGGLEVWNGAKKTMIGSSPNNTFTTSAWTYLELYFVIGHAGTLVIRVNGQTVLTLNGADLQAASPATVHSSIDGIEFRGPGAPTTTSLQIDDVYVCDTSAGPGTFSCDYFLGEVRVVPLHTTGNYGTEGFTPGPTAAHRVWKIDFLSSTGGTADIAELQFRQSAGVSTSFTGGLAFSTVSNSSLVTDGNPNTFAGFYAPGGWFYYDYGWSQPHSARVKISEVAITIRSGSVVNVPTRFKLSYYAGAFTGFNQYVETIDGEFIESDWVVVADVTIPAGSWTTPGQTLTFAVPDPTNWIEAHDADGDDSYNFSSTPGATDRFTFDALPSTITYVLAVQVVGAYRKDDAGTRIIQQVIGSASSEVLGAAFAIPQSYVYCYDMFTLDPSTGSSWQVSAVNGLHAGYSIAS